MTSVICWFDKSNDTCWPWAVADSRVSYNAWNGSRVLIDKGSKIFSFPVSIRETWGFGLVQYSANIAAAFAGNALVAHNTMLCLAGICGNLVPYQNSDPALPPPTFLLRNIADLLSQLASRFMNELAISMADRALSEFSLTGWCPASNEYKIFHIAPSENDKSHLQVSEFKPEKSDEVLILGVHQKEIRDRIVQIREKLPFENIVWWRAPIEALQQIIDEEIFENIGGYLQMGMTTHATKSFNLSAVVRPTESSGSFTLLGLDLQTEVGALGPFFVGMTGLIVR